MLQRIKWFQVAIVGAVLTILAGAGIYIGLIKPMQERDADADAKYQSQSNTLTEAKSDKPVAKKDREKAKGEVLAAQRDWARYDRTLMPDIDLSNRFSATRQLWNEQLHVLGPKVLKFIYDDKTVKIANEQVALAAPSGDPNAVVKKYFVYSLGSISVVGTFDQVLKNAERWNQFDRLALVDGLTLTGNSPTLTGQYNVTLYEFTHDDKVGPLIPQSEAVPGGGGRGGYGPPAGYGGPPAGFGGPPPGMMGPPAGYGGMPGGPRGQAGRD